MYVTILQSTKMVIRSFLSLSAHAPKEENAISFEVSSEEEAVELMKKYKEKEGYTIYNCIFSQ